jgi:hypothetical protein
MLASLYGNVTGEAVVVGSHRGWLLSGELAPVTG